MLLVEVAFYCFTAAATARFCRFLRATEDFSGRANATAKVTQALHVIEGGGNLAVSALGADVLRVFVKLVAFGEQVGAHGVLVVEVKEIDGLRDDY